MMKRVLAALAPALVPMLILAAPAGAQSVGNPPMGDEDGIVGPAFHVSDLARSLKFYKDVLGMRVAMQFGATGMLDIRAREAAGKLAEGNPQTTMVFSTSNPLSPMIMLLPEPAGSPRKIQEGYGYARLAMRVANLPAVNERLKAAGFAPGEIRGAHGTLQIMMVRDPDGYLVEMIERKPQRPAAAK